MKSQKNLFAVALLLSSTMFAVAAHAAGATGTNADYGSATSNDSADRTIEVTPATKWVNVANGETVRFHEGEHSFSWHFSTLNGKPFDLSAIAPKGSDLKGVRVYVDSDPLLNGA